MTDKTIAFSLLDLAPIPEGSSAREAFSHSLDLARLAEKRGYHRYWLAEHHNMTGIASAATSVLIGYLAANTTTLHLGSGGVMLPNHSPLVIAEQFGTLNTLYPGRIDLGLGRAPGSDQRTMMALRRHMSGDIDNFPRDVAELVDWFDARDPNPHVRPVPGVEFYSKYHHIYKGNNSRLDEMQAAFLSAKLPHLDKVNVNRRSIADKYLKGITNPEVILPFVPDYAVPVWHIFGIRCKRRDELEKFLNYRGITTNKHYPIPMHLQECYKDLGYKEGDFPIAEEISTTELSIPMFYGMTDEQIQYVIDTINDFK